MSPEINEKVELFSIQQSKEKVLNFSRLTHAHAHVHVRAGTKIKGMSSSYS